MTFGPSAHRDTHPPLRHADVLNGWSPRQYRCEIKIPALISNVAMMRARVPGKPQLFKNSSKLLMVFNYLSEDSNFTEKIDFPQYSEQLLNVHLFGLTYAVGKRPKLFRSLHDYVSI